VIAKLEDKAFNNMGMGGTLSFWRNGFPPKCIEDKLAKARQKMAANFMFN
jgi:hypothetical protein